MYINGTLDIASFEHVTADPVTELYEGRVIYRTDTKVPKIYQNGAWTELGAGAGGAGEINYVGNPDAELGTADWNEYSDTPGSSPVDGDGGTAGDLTLTANAVAGEVIRGTQSFKLAKGAANGQGQGYSTDIAIDAVDKNKLLKFEFEYWTSADYADDDIAVFIYDVDNATLITPSDNGIPGSTGTDADTSRRHAVQWVSTGSSNYRAIIHIATTNALAYDIHFDNVTVGPGKILTTPAIGPIENRLSEFTFDADTGVDVTVVDPTESSIFVTRNGEYAVIKGTLAFSAISAGDTQDFRISLPSGMTPDISKLQRDCRSGAINCYGPIGRAASIDNANIGVGNIGAIANIRTLDSGATYHMTFFNEGSPNPGNVIIDSTVGSPFNWGITSSRDVLQFDVEIPILEWAGSGVTNALTQDNLTEWTDYTAPGVSSWSDSNVESIQKRVGDSISLRGSSTVGTPSGAFTWLRSNLLPSGLNVDESKLVSVASTDNSSVGFWYANDGSTEYTGTITYDRSSNAFIFRTSDEGSINATGPIPTGSSWSAGDQISWEINVPITEWAGSQNSLVGFSEATPTELGLVKSNRWQRKQLTSTVNADTTAISDLTFNNLVIGKTYRISASAFLRSSGASGTDFATLLVQHNGSTLFYISTRVDGEASVRDIIAGNTSIFVATATTLTFDLDVNGISKQLLGSASFPYTYAIIEELNTHEDETTDFN
jgi:hypothetical protein